jgi:indole-3-glycerol phosphate synthase
MKNKQTNKQTNGEGNGALCMKERKVYRILLNNIDQFAIIFAYNRTSPSMSTIGRKYMVA